MDRLFKRTMIILLTGIGVPMAVLSGFLDYGFQVILGVIEKLEKEVKRKKI